MYQDFSEFKQGAVGVPLWRYALVVVTALVAALLEEYILYAFPVIP